MGSSFNRNRFVSEINVTPFVDVMLVLLVIFMVTAPMMDGGLEVDLPQTKQVDVLPSDSDHLVLTVKKDGTLFLDTYEIQLAELEQRIQILVTNKKRALFLKADSAVPYGVVVDIMSRVKSAGVEKLGIVATASDITASDLAAQSIKSPTSTLKNTAKKTTTTPSVKPQVKTNTKPQIKPLMRPLSRPLTKPQAKQSPLQKPKAPQKTRSPQTNNPK